MSNHGMCDMCDCEDEMDKIEKQGDEIKQLKELLKGACERLQHYHGDHLTQEFLNQDKLKEIID